MQPAIAIQNLIFSYHPQRRRADLQIDNWQVQRGEKIFIRGASGSGKSTLLNLICGTLTPQQGEISLLDQPVSRLSSRKRDKFRAQHVGVVFQQFNLVPYLSVADNVQLGRYFAGQQPLSTSHVAHLMSALQLPPTLQTRRADSLSIGQQQRVAIARALVNEPEILVVDEPTSALDSDARDAFMQLLLSQCEATQSTLLFVSHDRQLSDYFDNQIEMQQLNLAEIPS